MRKNILILAHNYGMQFLESCNQYTHIFDKKKYCVTVAFLIGPENIEIKNKIAAENIIFFDFSRKQIRGLKLKPIYKLYSLCRKNSFEMIICHRYKPTYIMLWVAQFCRAEKFIFVMHALNTISSWPRKLLIALLYKKNMIFAGVSNATTNDLKQNAIGIPQKNIITLYNVLDNENFAAQLLDRTEARKYLNIDNDVFLFGNIGRLVSDKDHQTVIKAFSVVKHIYPNTKLIIMGDGKLESNLKKLATSLNLEKHVIFAGFIPDGFRFMTAFDVLVHASVKEAFGRTLLEAMLARLPIIATKVGGIPEVVGDAGILIPEKSPELLAEKMKKLYDMKKQERNLLGDLGYQRMLENFTIEPFRKNFWNVINIIKEC